MLCVPPLVLFHNGVDIETAAMVLLRLKTLFRLLIKGIVFSVQAYKAVLILILNAVAL